MEGYLAALDFKEAEGMGGDKWKVSSVSDIIGIVGKPDIKQNDDDFFLCCLTVFYLSSPVILVLVLTTLGFLYFLLLFARYLIYNFPLLLY